MNFTPDAVHGLLALLAAAALAWGYRQRRGFRRTLDTLSSDQRVHDEIRHRERLASIGRLAAGVAHEIGNPVTGIACLAQNLRDAAAGEEVATSAEEILKQTRRIDRIVSSLVQFSHSGGLHEPIACSPCNVADCVDEAIHLLSLDRSAGDAHFCNHCDRELLVLADNQLLLQVFVNLLDNARWATPDGAAVDISAQRREELVQIRVDNPGAPIPAAVLDNVFEPFFTTKDVGEGTGLGLPLVRSMLEDMDGTIGIHSPRPEHGDGTRVQLQLHAARYADAAY